MDCALTPRPAVTCIGAVRTGVHKPSLVVLFAAHVLYVLLRKAGIARLDRRSIEYMVDKRGA